MKRLLVLLPFLLAGCVTAPPPTPMTWWNPAGTQQLFQAARYDCLQQAQQERSGAAWNGYGGLAVNRQVTNGSLFDSCMNSRGYHLIPTADAEALKAQYADQRTALQQRVNERCANPAFAVIFQHSACRVNDTTLENLSDTTFVTDEQKPALSAYAKELQDFDERDVQLLRSSRPAWVPIEQRSESEVQNNLALLYQGKETWGEYNQARKRLAQEQQAAVAALP